MHGALFLKIYITKLRGGLRGSDWWVAATDTNREGRGARFLGVWVDKGLGWVGHIGQVRGRVGRFLGVQGTGERSSPTCSIV